MILYIPEKLEMTGQLHALNYLKIGAGGWRILTANSIGQNRENRYKGNFSMKTWGFITSNP